VNLLIVDDDQAVLEVARYCLSERYQMHLASSGPEALLVLASRKIDVLITDQRMPGMDGSELCRQAAEISPCTAQIMITAYADFQDLRRAVKGGRLVDCLQKPLKQNELIAAIERAAKVSFLPTAGFDEEAPTNRLPLPATVAMPTKVSTRPRESGQSSTTLRAAEVAAEKQLAGARGQLRESRRALSTKLTALSKAH
jgi:CheY-like chemotaxis protein